jgi:ribosomal protein L15E
VEQEDGRCWGLGIGWRRIGFRTIRARKRSGIYTSASGEIEVQVECEYQSQRRNRVDDETGARVSPERSSVNAVFH